MRPPSWTHANTIWSHFTHLDPTFQGFFLMKAVVVVVVLILAVVCFIWFKFHKIGIAIANHDKNHPLPPIDPLLDAVNHPWVGCSCSRGIIKELQHQGLGRRQLIFQHYNPPSTKVNKYRFNFFQSPKPKPITYCDLENRPHHQSQPQGFAKKTTTTIIVIDCGG